jgi:hypothetical protein
MLNVYLYNIDTSLNYDTYHIVDNVDGRAWNTPPIKGGDTYPFQCSAGDDGYGDITITNLQSGVPNHFSFVRDGDIERL